MELLKLEATEAVSALKANLHIAVNDYLGTQEFRLKAFDGNDYQGIKKHVFLICYSEYMC